MSPDRQTHRRACSAAVERICEACSAAGCGPLLPAGATQLGAWKLRGWLWVMLLNGRKICCNGATVQGLALAMAFAYSKNTLAKTACATHTLTHRSRTSSSSSRSFIAFSNTPACRHSGQCAVGGALRMMLTTGPSMWSSSAVMSRQCSQNVWPHDRPIGW